MDKELKVMIDGKPRSPKEFRFLKINKEALKVVIPELDEGMTYPALNAHLDALMRAEERVIIEVIKAYGVELTMENAHRVERIYHFSDKGKYILCFDKVQLGMVYIGTTKVEFKPGEITFNTTTKCKQV